MRATKLVSWPLHCRRGKSRISFTRDEPEYDAKLFFDWEKIDRKVNDVQILA